MIAVSTRALMATLAIGVTLPSASSRTGTFLRSALATSTGTTAAGLALCLAPCRRAPESAGKHGNANQGERRHPK